MRIRDPGWKYGKKSDPGSGINIPDPQHCLSLICLCLGYINRLIKTEEEGGVTVYEVRHAAVQHGVFHEEEFEGCKFRVTAGDYQDLLQKVSKVNGVHLATSVALSVMDPDPGFGAFLTPGSGIRDG
jgi:hypothetical protein